MPQSVVSLSGMMTKLEIRQRRQLAYQMRARSSRLYGKLLIPVALVTLSTSLWSDPVLGPQLSAGVEEAKPLLASYAQNTPLDGVFGPVPEAAETAEPETVEGQEAAALDLTPELPTSVKPINRP